ncbi:MAG: hypothetical protein CMH57_15460 [Myxococcales bacterium]|nr:hypothetical protein [Myxococcales bacterium]
MDATRTRLPGLTALLALVFLVACGDDDTSSSVASNASNGATSAADAGDSQDTSVTADTGEGVDTAVADTAMNEDTGAPDSGADVEPDAPEETCVEEQLGGFWEEAAALELPITGQPIIRGTLQATIESLDGEPDLVLDEPRLAYIIDTGTQITSYNARLTGGSVAFFQGDVVEFDTLRLCEPVVKGRAIADFEAFVGVDVDVFLGQSMLMQLYTTIDYRNLLAWLYPAAPDSPPPTMEAETPSVLSYALQNQFPVSQVGFGVTLTGSLLERGEMEEACQPPGCCTEASCPLLMDTGSEATVITQTLFDQIEADYGEPLPKLQGYQWVTNLGRDEAFVTRLPSLQLGDGEVSGEWAVVVPDAYHVRAVLEGNGVVIEGFVGYPHFRHFLTEFRGPDSEFRFWPYPDDAHVPTDTWRRVGVDVIGSEAGPVVEMVFSPSDAATQGVTRGDRLVSVDGAEVVDMNANAVRLLLMGTPGETRTLELERDGEAVTVEVMIEDLLPPLP